MSAWSRLLRLKSAGLATAVVAVGPAPVAGHEGPGEIIAALTEQLAITPAGTTLLSRRAREYRTIGKLDLAAADLHAVLQREPQNLAALVEASALDLARGQLGPALDRINSAVALTAGERERAPLLILRAAIHEARGEWVAAQQDCDVALRQPLASPEWHLMRSRIDAKLGLQAKRAAALKQAFEGTGSALLEAEWIDALLDAGEWPAALQLVEPKLGTGRWQSTWLIRRARAWQGLGERALARADLKQAISEIEERLRPERPDPLLVRDRQFAESLLRASAEAPLQDGTAPRAPGATGQDARSNVISASADRTYRDGDSRKITPP